MDGILSSGVSLGGFLDEFSADRSCLLVRTLSDQLLLLGFQNNNNTFSSWPRSFKALLELPENCLVRVRQIRVSSPESAEDGEAFP